MRRHLQDTECASGCQKEEAFIIIKWLERTGEEMVCFSCTTAPAAQPRRSAALIHICGIFAEFEDKLDRIGIFFFCWPVFPSVLKGEAR
jgi:hypothetical protein